MDILFIEMLGAFFSLIFVIVSLVIALKIIYRYFEYKVKLLLLVGVSWVGLTFPWIPNAVSFILLLLTNQALNPLIKVLIEIPFLPLFLITWLIAFTDMFYKEKQQIILIITIIGSMIFEFIFFYFLITDVSLIGSFYPPMGVDYTPFILLYLFIMMAIFLITGLMFGGRSMKSTNTEIRLKGKFLVIAFISFIAGAVLDASVPQNPIMIIIIRTVLITSAIEYYFGFILPEWMKKAIIKKEQP